MMKYGNRARYKYNKTPIVLIHHEQGVLFGLSGYQKHLVQVKTGIVQEM